MRHWGLLFTLPELERTMQRHEQELTPAPVEAKDESDSSLPYSSPLLPNLPDDVALQCIARVPRFCHGELSLVSKSWHSLIRSPIFFSTHKRLNCTQHVLFLNSVWDISNGWIRPANKWLAVDIDPSNPKSISQILHHVDSLCNTHPECNAHLDPPNPPMPFFPLPSGLSDICFSSVAVLGPKIYFLGCTFGRPKPSGSGHYSSTVWIFDCRFNRWRIGPPMGVERSNFAAVASSAACVVNGKIYVMGGCSEDSSNWAEVFDPTLRYWVAVPSPIDIRMECVSGTALVGEKFYIWGSSFHRRRNILRLRTVIFDSCDSSWHEMPIWLNMIRWNDGSACVVDGIWYRPSVTVDGEIEGLDVKDGKWRTVNLAQKHWGTHSWDGIKTVVNVGGRLLVLWRQDLEKNQYSLSCAEVEVRKDSNGGLWSSTVSSQLLMVLPRWSYLFDWCTVELCE